MNKSESIAKLAEALALAQSELPFPKLDKESGGYAGKSYKYASLFSVLTTTRPILAKHNLCVIQTIESAADGTNLVSTLAHSSGEWVSSRIKLLYDPQKMQSFGSALTYARRYGYIAIVGVVADEDWDGESAESPEEEQNAAAATAKTYKALVRALITGEKATREALDDYAKTTFGKGLNDLNEAQYKDLFVKFNK